jgi:hypothetical protein
MPSCVADNKLRIVMLAMKRYALRVDGFLWRRWRGRQKGTGSHAAPLPGPVRHKDADAANTLVDFDVAGVNTRGTPVTQSRCPTGEPLHTENTLC